MQLPFQKIHSKYQFYSFTLVLLAGGLGLLFYVHSLKKDSYQKYQYQLSELPLFYAKMHQAEQNFKADEAQALRFLKTKQSKYLDEYEQQYRRLQKTLKQLKQNPTAERLGQNEALQKTEAVLKEYRKHTLEFADKTKQLGKEDLGVEGTLKKDFEALAEVPGLTSAHILGLKQFKNEFLLYKNTDAIQSFKKETYKILDEARQKVNIEDSIGRKKMAKIVQSLEQCSNTMDRLVALHQYLGLDAQSGLKAKINQHHQDLNKYLLSLQAQAEAQLALMARDAEAFVWTVFTLALLLATLLSLVIARIESTPLVSLNRIAQSLRNGIKNQDKLLNHRNFQRNDEIGSIAKHFQHFIGMIRNTLHQVKEKDIQLEKNIQQEVLRTWHSEGLALFRDIFRRQYPSQEQQAFEIISELVKYTHSQQGGLFIVQHEAQPSLALTACYAYERQKYKQKDIQLGEGLVGTAWKENKTLLITDIPNDYTYIKSALGKASPRALLIVPIKLEEEVVGIVELLALHPYQAHQIEFVENLAGRIGSALVTARVNERNQRLLLTQKQIVEESKEKENKLNEQIKNYQYWLEEFERKLKQSTEANEIYQAVVNKMYKGMIVTNEKFRIIMVNDYILKRYNHQEQDLIDLPLETLLDTDYEYILDLRERKFKLSQHSFEKNLQSKIIDKTGKATLVESISGKLEIEEKVVYIFMLNELSPETREAQNNNSTVPKLKVAS